MEGKQNQPTKKEGDRAKIRAKNDKSISDKPNNSSENSPRFSITAPSVWR